MRVKENVIKKIIKILGKYQRKSAILLIFCRLFLKYFLLEIGCSFCFEKVVKEEKERKRKNDKEDGRGKKRDGRGEAPL